MSKSLRQAVVLLSCASLVVAGSGCAGVPPQVQAQAARQHVAAGMTRDEVADKLGEPTKVIAPAPAPAVEAWVYAYPRTSAAETVLTVVAMVVLVVLVVALVCACCGGKGGGNLNFGGGGGGGGGPPCEFLVLFGADGRVMTVTPIHAARAD